MLISYKNGATGIILRLVVTQDTTGANPGYGFTGLANTSTGLNVSTIADNEASATTYTSAGSTIDTITTLGTYAAPTATHCRLKKVDDTNLPGLIELQLDNARFAVSGAKELTVFVTGVSGMMPCRVKIPLTSVDPYSANNFATGLNGQTYPAAAPGASGGLMISGSNTGPWTVTNGVTFTNGSGDGLLCRSTGGNGAGLDLQGNGTGDGLSSTGGSTGFGAHLIGGASGGVGLRAEGAGANADGVTFVGVGTGSGLRAAAGASGVDVRGNIIGDVTGNLSGSVGSVTGAVGSVAAAVTLPSIPANWITAAGIAAAALDGKGDWLASSGYPANFGSLGISATGHVSNVDTLTTYTGNTPQTGDAYARLGAPAGASVSADVAAVKSDTGTILTDVNVGAGAIYSRLGAPAGASIAADIAAVGGRVWDVARSGHATTGTFGAVSEWASGGSAPTAAQNAAAVWDLATAGHTTSGTFGAAMNAAGSAGDPWATAEPGPYAAGTFGHLVAADLPAVLAKLNAAGQTIAVTSPVPASGGVVPIVRGDDYYAADGRALVWHLVTALAVTAVELRIYPGADGASPPALAVNGTVTPTADGYDLAAELTAAQTQALDPLAPLRLYGVRVTLADGHKVTPFLDVIQLTG